MPDTSETPTPASSEGATSGSEKPRTRFANGVALIAVVISLIAFLLNDSRDVRVNSLGVDTAIKNQCLDWAAFVIDHPHLDHERLDGIGLRASHSTRAIGQEKSVLELCGDADEYRSVRSKNKIEIAITSSDEPNTSYGPSPKQGQELERLIDTGVPRAALERVLGFDASKAAPGSETE